MFNAAIDGRLKALWLIGEDVVQTDPNTNKVKKAMDSLELLVVPELFMTETANTPTWCCPAPASWKRAAPSPTASAACSA
ncbi:MAG: hypothetical protein R2810_03615 [Flavobacteriales bacterium]